MPSIQPKKFFMQDMRPTSNRSSCFSNALLGTLQGGVGLTVYGSLGALSAYIMNISPLSGGVFGAAAYVGDQIAHKIFDPLLKKYENNDCAWWTLKAVEVLAPRLLALAALAGAGLAFSAWQAVALIAVNIALPILFIAIPVILGMSISKCCGEAAANSIDNFAESELDVMAWMGAPAGVYELVKADK